MFKELSKTLQSHPTASFLSSLRSCRFANKFHSTFNRKLIYFWGISLSFTTFFLLFNVHTDAKKKKQSPNTGTQIWHPEELVFFIYSESEGKAAMEAIQITKECANDFLGPAGIVTDSRSSGQLARGGEERPHVREPGYPAFHYSATGIHDWRHLLVSCFPNLPLGNQSLSPSPACCPSSLSLEYPALAHPHPRRPVT